MVSGTRFDRYHELSQHAFGEKLGLYIVVPQQVIVMLGGNIVYMVIGGASLQKFHDIVCPSCKKIRLTFFIMIFASAQFLLSHLPSFNSISGVSLVAAVMSIGYINFFLFFFFYFYHTTNNFLYILDFTIVILQLLGLLVHIREYKKMCNIQIHLKLPQTWSLICLMQ